MEQYRDIVHWCVFTRIIIGDRLDYFKSVLKERGVSFIEMFDGDLLCYDIYRYFSYAEVLETLGVPYLDDNISVSWPPIFHKYMEAGKYGSRWNRPGPPAQEDFIYLNRKDGAVGDSYCFRRRNWSQDGLEILKKKCGVNFPDEMNASTTQICLKFRREFPQKKIKMLHELVEKWFALSSTAPPPLGITKQPFSIETRTGIAEFYSSRAYKRIPKEPVIVEERVGRIAQLIRVNLSEAHMETVHALLSMLASFCFEKNLNLEDVIFA